MILQGWSKTILFKITFLFSLISVIVLISFGTILTKLIEHHFIEMDLDLLNNITPVIAHDMKNIRNDDDLITQLEEIIHKYEITALVVDNNNTLIYTNHDLQRQYLDTILAQTNIPLSWESGSGMYRGIRSEISTPHPALPQANMIVATEIRHHTEFMAYLHYILLITITVSILFLGIFGCMVTRFALLPLRRIIGKTFEVSSEKLDIRLDVESLPYELKDLATSINTMLARLEDSFQRLIVFSSDLAHELRTPVSNMKTQTQVALMHSRTIEEYNDILQSNVEELDQLSRMINDMLLLAKAENGLELLNRERIAVERELDALFEFYEAIAGERGITFTLTGQAAVIGDKPLLRRALSNLLLNAITHGAADTVVRVTLERVSPKQVRITVAGRGETIAPEHLPKLFDRFYRMDSARRRSSDGVGLGLAITRSIVQAHNGTITAGSELGCTEFHVTLPEA